LCKLLDDMYIQFKDDEMILITFANRSVVFLFNFEQCNTLLKMKSLYNKPSLYNSIKYFVRDGLVTSSGNYWKNNRKLLNSSFHIEILNSYIPSINEEGFILLGKLEKFSANNFFDIKLLMHETTLNIIT
ncbi:cytochrome P450 monooxygenase-like protein, partial [Leptotrombidium deliense]